MSVTEFSRAGRGASLTQTSAVPLTTLFTPNHDCTAFSAYDPTYWAGNQWAYQLDWGINTPSCYPSGYSTYQFDSSLWYSPGVCPYSYEYVATSIQRTGSEPATTLAICCPPGIHNGPGGTAFSCVQVLTTSVTDLSFSDNQSGSAPAPTTAFANAISVAWQEKDLSLFTPASAPLIALRNAGATFPPSSSTSHSAHRTTGSPTSSTSSLSTSSTDTAAPDHSSGLSPGAAAGIGVGATIGAIAIVAGIWWFARHYKFTKREQNNRQWQSGDQLDGPWYEKDGGRPHFAKPMAEAPDTGLPYEADNREYRAELDAGWQKHEAGKGVRSPT